MRSWWLLALALAALVVASSAPAKGSTVRLGQRPAALTAGQPWAGTLVVRGARPARVTVAAVLGTRRATAAARPAGKGRYSFRLVLSAAGRWALAARVGNRRFELGAIRVVGPGPVVLSQATEIALDPSGALLVAERGRNRVARVHPATGRVSTVVDVPSPYGLAVAPSGDLYVSSGTTVRRVAAAGGQSAVAQLDAEIGPLAVGADGSVYFTTATRIYRIVGGSGAVEDIGGNGIVGNDGDGGPALAASFDAPHGLAVTEGVLWVGDGGNDRIRRIDLATGIVTHVVSMQGPAGLGVAPDGTPLVCEQRANRLLRVDVPGRVSVVAGSGVRASTGDGGPAAAAALHTPTDVVAAADGTLFVQEGTSSGRVRRIAPDGRIDTLRRR